MQWTAVFILGCCLHLSAAVKSQNVTFEGKNVPLKQIMQSVKKQTGYSFLFNEEKFNLDATVTITANQMQLKDFLTAIFKDQPIAFSFEGSTVLLEAKKPQPVLEATPPITIRGKVVNEKGEPVSASVVIKGTKIGVTTDSYGTFEIQNVPDNAILVISGISIEPQEIKVEGKSEINIRAMTRISAEEEVTISTGYITSTKRKSTANISKVNADEIENQPVTNPLMALQGRVAGLDVTPTNGFAGSAPKIRIRGENSLREYNPVRGVFGAGTAGGFPLYVIDGVPLESKPLFSNGDLSRSGFDPLASISVSNIESIEVLKDGAATGIYGSRGANGVILVTTKKGKNKSGHTALDVNYYTGVGRMSNYMDVLNTKEYLAMRHEALANDGGTMGDFDFDINGSFDTTRDVNWQKELLGGTAKNHDFQTYLSGGNQFTSFRIGGNIHTETTIYPGDFGFRNITGSGNITHTTADQKLRLSLTTNYSAARNNIINSGAFLNKALSLAPDAPELYKENGELNWQTVSLFGGSYITSAWMNPMADLLNTQEIKSATFLSSLNIEYHFTPDFFFRSNFGFNTVESNEVAKNPIAANAPENIPYVQGSSRFTTNKRTTWIIEPQLVYRKKINAHNFTGIVGGSLQQMNTILESVNGSGYQSDALLGSILGAPTKQFTDDVNNEYRYVAGFGIIKYDFDSKYLLDLNFRRDGSSRFGPGKQFGNFGSAGIGWVFSREKMLAHSSGLSYGKIRASYGITGNDQIDDYRYYSTYSIGTYPYFNTISLYPDALFNENLGWESTKKLEAAVELGFLRDNIFLEVVYYRNRSSNQLVGYTLPLTTGFETITTNFDATVQNMGWEAAVSTKNVRRGNFKWTSSFNITFPKNKLVSFPGIESTSYAKRYKVGESLGILNQYHFTGIDPETGKATILDLDSNNSINANDKIFTYSTDRVFYGGLTNNFFYKSFEFSFLIQFTKQLGFRPWFGLPGSNNINQPAYVLERWRKVGDITEVQRYNQDYSIFTEYDNQVQSDYLRQDASFIRLKTLSLAWSLPKRWTSNLKMSQAKVIMQAQNLFTITGYDGLDPETGPTALPPLRMITGGVQVTF